MPVVDIPLLPGIREDFSPVNMPPGWLTDARNVRFGRQGEIRARAGTLAIPANEDTGFELEDTGNVIGAVGKVGSAGAIAVAGQLAAYDGPSVRERWHAIGAYSTCEPVGTIYTLFSETAGSRARCGVAVDSNGYVLVVGNDGQIVLLNPDGIQIHKDEVTSTRQSVLVANGAFVIVSQNGTALSARTVSFSSGSVVASSGTSVGTLGHANYGWDVTPADDGTHWYLAHVTSGTNLRIDRFAGTTSNANTSVTVVADTGVACPCSLYADATDVWVGWWDIGSSGQVRYRTFAPNLSAARSAVTTIATNSTYGCPLFGPHPTTSGSAIGVIPISNSTAVGFGRVSVTSPGSSGTAGTVGTVFTCWGGVPVSKPDSAQRVWLMLASSNTNWTTERAAFIRLPVAESDPIEPTVELAYYVTEKPNAANLAYPQQGFWHHVAEGTDGDYFAVSRLVRKAPEDGTDDMFIVDVLKYKTLAHSTSRQLVPAGPISLVNGQPVEVFGQGILGESSLSNGTIPTTGAAEIGFLLRPFIVSGSSIGGSTPLSAGTYQWSVMYEWTGPTGARHRSAPSPPFSLTVSAGDIVSLKATRPMMSQRSAFAFSNDVAAVRLILYRTVANGSTLYYAGWVAHVSTPSSGTNDIEFGDSYSDAAIEDNEILYTNGGALQNDLAPSCSMIAVGEDRLCCAGLWDPRLIQFSKIRLPNEQDRFSDSDAFKVVIPESVTGLAYLDGNYIAFCENAIYAVSGSGPNDQGQGAFAPPRAITRDLGCIDKRSVLETAVGVFFQGRRGIYLLPRGLGAPIFVGAAVQRITADYSTVLGATVYNGAESRSARFLVSNGTAERMLVYDLDIAASDPLAGWSYDQYPSSIRLSAIGQWPGGIAVSRASITNEAHALFHEEAVPTVFSDPNGSSTVAFSSEVTTGDLRLAGLAGWFACRAVGCVLTGCVGNVTVFLTVNTDGTANESDAVTTTERNWFIDASADKRIYKFVHPTHQQCSAAQVTLFLRGGISGGVTGRGPNIHGLSIDWSGKEGLRRAIEAER